LEGHRVAAGKGRRDISDGKGMQNPTCAHPKNLEKYRWTSTPMMLRIYLQYKIHPKSISLQKKDVVTP
jgi:hypothetical protein